MNNSVSRTRCSLGFGLTALLLSLSFSACFAGEDITPGVLPPLAHAYGKTYGEWSAAWWTWAMSLPLDRHPLVDPNYDVSEGQTGHVWFLASPFGTIERSCTIPPGTALFIAMNTAEASNLEGLGNTQAEQAATAKWFADHAVTPDHKLGSFCIIDGVEVKNIAQYRVQSPQFSFTAPTPWIFGDIGGTGTSVADGYYVLVAPLSAGQHTIRFGETWHFAVAEGDPFDFDAGFDTTFQITINSR